MTAADQRPLAEVPRWLWALLGCLLAAQIGCQGLRARLPLGGSDLPPPPSVTALRLASFGEAAMAARLELLYLQAFDQGAANELLYQNLDYGRLTGWLRVAVELDPRSEYPLFLAARVYTEISDPARIRRMLDFVEEEFRADPDHRWQWLAHASLLAKHRLKDLPLARRYAAEIDHLATSPEVPAWARQMEIFILEDMNELQAAKVLLGGLLASGKIRDQGEARFLQQRLQELEARMAAGKVK